MTFEPPRQGPTVSVKLEIMEQRRTGTAMTERGATFVAASVRLRSLGGARRAMLAPNFTCCRVVRDCDPAFGTGLQSTETTASPSPPPFRRSRPAGSRCASGGLSLRRADGFGKVHEDGGLAGVAVGSAALLLGTVAPDDGGVYFQDRAFPEEEPARERDRVRRPAPAGLVGKVG